MEYFDYELPQERIAQWPTSRQGSRADARLLHADGSGASLVIHDRRIPDILSLIRGGDYVVLNNSRVRPSRFFPRLGDGREVELLLLNRIPERGVDVFAALARPMKLLRNNEPLAIGPGLTAIPLGRDDSGDKLVIQLRAEDGGSVDRLIEQTGLMPIPPYIRSGRSESEDVELYQTVYAEVSGSLAAPTAGLHFTPELLTQIEKAGAEIVYLTHHVGSASFRQAMQQDPNLERLEEESYAIDPDTFERLLNARAKNRRVLAVGTTTTRALESFAMVPEAARTAALHSTELCIKPPFRFQVVDRLFTNFHQPGSTHLLLVSAFFGADRIRAVYGHALQNGYRFLSYGDAMFLEREP